MAISTGKKTSIVATYCVYTCVFYGCSLCDDGTGGTVRHTVYVSAAFALTTAYVVPWGINDSRDFRTRVSGDGYGFGDDMKGIVPVENAGCGKVLNVI